MRQSAQTQSTGMNRDEDHQSEARALRAIACLFTLLDEALKRDHVAWRELGGFEAQDLLRALETGGSHPLLRQWEQLKAGPAANRPAPAPSEQSARRFIVLLRIALERAGMGKTEAREHIASAIRRHGRQVGLPTTTGEAIRHWERDLAPPPGPQDDAVINTALDRCGNDAAQLTRHFLGFVEFARKPLPTWARWR
jgi:hypothetical protein